MYIYDLLFTDGVATRAGLLNLVSFLVALVMALMLHEIAHGLVAFWCGDPTAKLMGRLSLNPMKHFDFFGMLLFLLCGFGWAKPVPVNPDNFKSKRGMVFVSLAGIATNIVLAFLFTLPYVVFLNSDVCTQNIIIVLSNKPVDVTAVQYLQYFLFMLAQFTVSINISFALFNFLPLYPLDGYRFLSCYVSQNNGFMTFLRKYSFYIIIGLVLLENIPAFDILGMYMSSVGGFIRNVFNGFWGLVI